MRFHVIVSQLRFHVHLKEAQGAGKNPAPCPLFTRVTARAVHRATVPAQKGPPGPPLEQTSPTGVCTAARWQGHLLTKNGQFPLLFPINTGLFEKLPL